jgi:citrate synthase
MEGMLDSTEAARRLGVKVSTLYVYVSRGLIESQRDRSGRRSLFALADVERLARRSHQGRTVETRLATITTSVTQITDLGPSYRGTPATEILADRFESVAERLWQHPPGPWTPLPLSPPSGLRTHDLLRCVVAMAGSLDAVRSDRRPDAVVRAARHLIATVVASLVDPGAPLPRSSLPIAESLAGWMCHGRPSPGLVEATNAALVALVDHELATSTVAVRLAASTRADLYDATLAGLGVLGGPLHGANSEIAHRLLVRASELGAAGAIDEALRWQAGIPGIGMSVYASGDPRFPALRPYLDRVLSGSKRAVLDALVDVVSTSGLPQPNVDLALGALVWGAGAPADAGPVLFTVARMAGWVAHYLEELDERPLRFRSRAVYATAAAPDTGEE